MSFTEKITMALLEINLLFRSQKAPKTALSVRCPLLTWKCCKKSDLIFFFSFSNRNLQWKIGQVWNLRGHPRWEGIFSVERKPKTAEKRRTRVGWGLTLSSTRKCKKHHLHLHAADQLTVTVVFSAEDKLAFCRRSSDLINPVANLKADTRQTKKSSQEFTHEAELKDSTLLLALIRSKTFVLNGNKSRWLYNRRLCAVHFFNH